jgi:predicted nucleotidyltransferase
MFALKSIITKKLLNYFFINPHESLYVNEIARKLKIDKRNLVKKIRELEKEGIFIYQKRGNMKLYSINGKYPLYKEYKNIILKTVGFEETLRQIIKGSKGVKKGYIYGSYATDKMDTHSDIDILVIGDHDIAALQHKLIKVQKELEREINVVNMDIKEYKQRELKKDPFIAGILKNKRIRLL